MFYIFDVGVGDSINVRCEVICKLLVNYWIIQYRIEKDVIIFSEFVVDFFFE